LYKIWENNQAEPLIHYYPKILAFIGYYPFPEPNSLAARIVQYRHEKGITQKKLGMEIGVDGSTVSDWENGHTKPKGKYLKTLLSKIKSGN
jgi:DNA-binding XRE family transcriptional regulator